MRLSFIYLLTLPFCLNTQGYSKQPIHDHGYWQGTDIVNEHQFDPLLADALSTFFMNERAQSIVDFGCGMGDYVKHLLALNFDCKGYDGNPNTSELTDGVASVIDLSQSFNLGRQFDWVMCLEVGEHLPKRYESTLIKNLHRHNAKGIVLSWAIKGQGGYGHFNEQNNGYIKNIMKRLGYINDLESERFLRAHSSLPWFKNTIMVFRKKG